MKGRLLAWSLSIAFILGPFAPAGATLAPEGVRVIATDTTFEDGLFVFHENLVVAPGATLTFRHATVFLDAPTFCPTRGSAGYCQPSILLEGGTLRILDSVVDNHAWNEHDFDSGWSVAGFGATLEIRDSTLTHYKSIGLQLPGAARSVVADSTFTQARGSLSFIRGAAADVTGNGFQGLYTGVGFHDSESTLVGNTFRSIGRDYGAGLFGRAIDVQSTLVGDKSLRAMTLVKDNLVEGAVQGMLNLNGFPNEIRNNLFRGNKQGLTIGISVGDDILHTEAPLVTGNRFENNTDAIDFYTSGAYQDPSKRVAITAHVHENAFVDTRCAEIAIGRVDARVDLTVDATRNWWGSPLGPQDHGPTCPALAGPGILVDPWLTEEP